MVASFSAKKTGRSDSRYSTAPRRSDRHAEG